jgi:hypothetical protein
VKNPWLSLWMSAANRGAATARGHWLAEARRQQRAAEKAMAKAMSGTAPTKKPARRRKKPGS